MADRDELIKRLRSALTAMLAVYEELHAHYDLGECQATIDARAALAPIQPVATQATKNCGESERPCLHPLGWLHIRQHQGSKAGKVQADILGQCCHGGMKRKKDCASCAAWPVRPISQPSNAVHSVTDQQIEDVWHSLDGKSIIAGESSLNWNKVIRIAFARALLTTANAGKEKS